jgi:hypothetical protein
VIAQVRTWLDSLDGPVVVGWALLALALLWLACALVDRAVRHPALPRGPRQPSRSENHYRLDAAASRATTRPSSSSRKAGRVPAGGTR